LAAKVTTPYVFLYRKADSDDWRFVTESLSGGQPHVGHSRGAEQATRDLVKNIAWLQELAEKEGCEVWPIPQRSHAVFPVRLVRPEPIIKVG
jgi:hypothetical protein